VARDRGDAEEKWAVAVEGIVEVREGLGIDQVGRVLAGVDLDWAIVARETGLVSEDAGDAPSNSRTCTGRPGYRTS
jgi:hypothetical protein